MKKKISPAGLLLLFEVLFGLAVMLYSSGNELVSVKYLAIAGTIGAAVGFLFRFIDWKFHIQTESWVPAIFGHVTLFIAVGVLAIYLYNGAVPSGIGTFLFTIYVIMFWSMFIYLSNKQKPEVQPIPWWEMKASKRKHKKKKKQPNLAETTGEGEDTL